MQVFDKAQWHIDAGEPANEVIARLKVVFQFLAERGLLSAEGKEIWQFGIDSSASLHERLVNEEGAKFLSAHYDDLIGLAPFEISKKLAELY
jgi:hypothetical protein